MSFRVAQKKSLKAACLFLKLMFFFYFFYRLIRDQILAGDFSTIVKLLQNYPNVETRVILNKAAELNVKNRE